jgi:hypothetical protein
MIKNKTYIVFPHGLVTKEELQEAIELLNISLKNPKIVKHNGLWNVEADLSKASIERINFAHCIFCESMFQWASATCELMETDELSVSELWNAEPDVAEAVM